MVTRTGYPVGWIGVGRAGLNAQAPNKTHAVPEPSMGEGTAEVEAPAFMPPRHLTWRIDCPRSGLHMNNGVRSSWPAFTSGTREGGKPSDKSSATCSHKPVDRPDLIPMVTRETCAGKIVNANR